MVYLYQYIPNFLTFLRMVSAPFLWHAILSRNTLSALALLTFAVLSDFGDGYMARRLFITSRSGSFLDPLADKFVVLAAFYALWQLHIVPLWVVGIIAVRDVLVTWLRTFLLRRKISLRTTFLAKIKTAMQFAVLYVCVACLGMHQLPENLLYGVSLFIALITVLSALPYAYRCIFFLMNERDDNGCR